MYIMHKSLFFQVLSNFVVIFYFSHYCFVFPLTRLSFIQLLPYYFASDPAIIQNSLIGSNGGNRCLCKVCAGGAQSNNSVGAQSNCVTRCDYRGLSLRCCNFRFFGQITYNHVHSYVTFIIINQVLVRLVIFCDFAEFFFLTVFMLCNKYNTCILTTVLMYYTIFIVADPYSLDLFISSSSLLCKTCMLLFALLAVSLRFDP